MSELPPRAAIVAPFSGPRRAWGELLLDAAARRDDIDWIAVDDEGRAELGPACARRVVDSGAVAVVGHFNSGGAAGALPHYAAAQLPCLLPLATAPELTALAPGLVLRQCPTDADQARALVEALADDVAVVDDGSAYGETLARRLAACGAARIAGSGAARWEGAIVVSAVHRAGAAIARELRARGCTAQLAFVDDCGVDEFEQLAGDAAAGALIARFPGGGQRCVDELVDVLADALVAAPLMRGRLLVQTIRALAPDAYDIRGERVAAAWDVRALAPAALR